MANTWIDVGAGFAATIGDWLVGQAVEEQTQVFSALQLELLQELFKAFGIGVAEKVAKYLSSFENRIAALERKLLNQTEVTTASGSCSEVVAKSASSRTQSRKTRRQRLKQHVH